MNEDWTLKQLRDWLRPQLETGGVECPLCRQHAQAYKRMVTSAMVKVLARMLDTARASGHEDRWVKLADIEQETRASSMLHYWRLIREHGEKRGWWQVTEEGRLFLLGKTTISKYAHVYRNRVYAQTGPQVRVYDVEPKFDFDKHVREIPKPEQLGMESK